MQDLQQAERRTPPREKLLDMYWQMHAIRGFEEKVAEYFQRGLIYGTTHLYIGQEASAVGAIATLREGDYITSTHRGHGHMVAMGGSLRRMMAELMGKATGYCGGKGGSMHIVDMDLGHLGANGIVAGGIPTATGAALALKMQGRPGVVLCFFGDGATNEGAFHEAVNLGAIWRLPVVYVCENNQYGMSGPVQKMSGNPNLHERAIAYGIPGEAVDGQDAIAVYDAVSRAVERARSGEGPTLLNVLTYRYMGHSKSDANRYRTREEIEAWKRRDPIPIFRSYLLSQGFTEEQLAATEQKAAADVEDAVQFALESPDPEPETLEQDVYAG